MQPQPPPARPAGVARIRQIEVSDAEKLRLGQYIFELYIAAQSNHLARVLKFKRLFRMWRGLMTSKKPREGGRNFEVPLLKWIILGQLSKFVQSIFGDGAEIVAEPQNPEAEKSAKMVGAYMTWRVFNYMGSTLSIIAWLFRAVIFGRSHAEILYVQEYFWERNDERDIDVSQLHAEGIDYVDNGDGTIDVERLVYDGPRLVPLWPNEIVLPAQDVPDGDVNKFAWTLRRDRITPGELLEGEKRGRYAGVTENWGRISAIATQAQEREPWYDAEKHDADEAEGVDKQNIRGNRDSLEVWRWYGKYRFPKGKRDVRVDNAGARSMDETEVVVHVLPGMANLVIGVQDLRDLFPRIQKRNPILDIATMADGTYWTPGLGELLEDIQSEFTVNFGIFRQQGMLQSGPIVFYKPGGGFNPNTFKYEPGTAIPTMDPASVQTLRLQGDLGYSQQMTAVLKGMAELLSGVSDQTNGQSIDRPNAPRTLGGQQLLQEEGNVRAALDMTIARVYLARAFTFIWQLDREYADPEVVFRATGKDGEKLFDTNTGFGTMTAQEREHGFDFDVKFATSNFSREMRKSRMMQLYQISVGNPLVATNPHALWELLNRVWEANGEKNFRAIIPEPPMPEQSKPPDEEWEMILSGDPPEVNPLDDDMLHLVDHRRRIETELNKPAERIDRQAVEMGMHHVMEHEQQRRQKLLLAQVAHEAMKEMAGHQVAPPPSAPPMGGQPGQPAGPVPAPNMQPAPGGMQPLGGQPNA